MYQIHPGVFQRKPVPCVVVNLRRMCILAPLRWKNRHQLRFRSLPVLPDLRGIPGISAVLASLRIRCAVLTRESLSGVVLKKKGEYFPEQAQAPLRTAHFGQKGLVFTGKPQISPPIPKETAEARKPQKAHSRIKTGYDLGKFFPSKNGPMPDILLATCNARYTHASFGLRYLLANMGELSSRTAILEFDIARSTLEVAEAILAQNPRILGLGVYIWNVTGLTELVALLKRIAPKLIIILGGPEVSHESQGQRIVSLSDYTLCGEADLAFAKLCRDLLGGKRPLNKVIEATPPHFADILLPYAFYNKEDIAHRVIYVEASRGCPFTCEFCLSSLDIPVRNVPLEPFLIEMEKLIDRGVRQFKFVDRTFNLNASVGTAILGFFLKKIELGLFIHFEMIPDRLPDVLKEQIKKFPSGSLQFEVGIQSLNPIVQGLISRRQNNPKTMENLRWLRAETNVHIHADLIAGLPGETLASFGEGFDQLYALGPQEIQVGVLKRLRGTPIVRHDEEWEMVYSGEAPYEILANKLIDFATMCQVKRFARYWDLLANSGRLPQSLPLLLASGSAFDRFMHLSDWLWRTTGQAHGIALARTFELVFAYASDHYLGSMESFAMALWRDYHREGRSDKPSWAAHFGFGGHPDGKSVKVKRGAERQSRHLGPAVEK